MEKAKVIGVSKSKTYTFSKFACQQITLIEGLGVEDDVHSGKTVKHRYIVRKDPTRPNLRQVHLMHAELFDELAVKGFKVDKAQLGENITTFGIDLLNLPLDTILKIGQNAEIKITGLRDPCSQIDNIQKGLMKALLERDEEGNLQRKAGIMGTVIKSGEVSVNDEIQIYLPNEPHQKLHVV